MSYLVMECHPGYVVLLDEEGRFFKAANLRYETGQTVYEPVLMKESPGKQKYTIRWISSGIAAVAVCFLLFWGVSYYQSYMRPYSRIYLTINPQVQLDLNRQGTVVGLAGVNEDGQRLLEGYDGKGKNKVTVSNELIDRAIEMGFLSEGGQVSFSIDSPDEALFQEYGAELRVGVAEHLDGRITIEIVNHKSMQREESMEDSSSLEESQPEQTPSAPLPEESQPEQTPSAPLPEESQPEQTPSAPLPEPSQPTVTPPASSGSSNYGNTDYGLDNDGVTDYNNGNTDYDDDPDSDDGGSNYSDYGDDDDDD